MISKFYLKVDILLLADAFKTLKEMYLKFFPLDPPKFLSAPGLAWEATSKKTKAMLELLTAIDIGWKRKKRRNIS